MCSRIHRYVLLVCAVSALAGHRVSIGQDWPGFLGPHGTARSPDLVPTEWDDDKNLLWKLDLPGAGSSSPIIVGRNVFVTCYSRNDQRVERYVVCVDKQSGQEVWTKTFPAEDREDAYRGYLTEHGYASNTPVSDGQYVYVFFGKGGVHALDMEGNVRWSAEVGQGSSNRQWGSAASLLLCNDRLIVNAAEESQALIALDKKTGEELWRQEAEMLSLTYGTPRCVQLPSGKTELLISVPGEMWALSPSTGKLKWFSSTPMTGNVSPSVIIDGQNAYSFGGYRSSGSISVKAGGDGDVSDSHVNWTSGASSYVATPLLYQRRFYWIDDRGMAMCIDAETGDTIYRERVKGLSGRPVYASPVLIGGNIFVVTRNAGTIVYPPGDEFRPIARNRFAADDSDFNASPGVSQSRLVPIGSIRRPVRTI